MRKKLLVFGALLSLTACGGGSVGDNDTPQDTDKTVEQLALDIESGGIQVDVNDDYMRGEWLVYNLGKGDGKNLQIKGLGVDEGIEIKLNDDGTIDNVEAPPVIPWKAYQSDFIPILQDGQKVLGELGEEEGFPVYEVSNGNEPSLCQYTQAPNGAPVYSQYALNGSNFPGNPYWNPVLKWQVIDQGFSKFVNFTIKGQDYPVCIGNIENGKCSCLDVQGDYCQQVSPGSASLAECYAPKDVDIGEGSNASLYPNLGFPVQTGANNSGFVVYTAKGEKILLLKGSAI